MSQNILLLLVLTVIVLIIGATIGVVVVVYVLDDDASSTPPDQNPVTGQLAPQATSAPPVLPGIGRVTYAPTGQYAFPLAADPTYFAWTDTDRSGGNGTLIEPRLTDSRNEFDQVIGVQTIAVIGGIVRHHNRQTGELGLILQGNDGQDFYYGNLATIAVNDGAVVRLGQPLGPISHGPARYTEPHLYFALGPRDTLWQNEPPVNAAEWINATFQISRTQRPTAALEASSPSGWPVLHPQLIVATPFHVAMSNGLPEPAIELGFIDPVPKQPHNVYATLGGIVNVIRWTGTYGTRIQITNDLTRTTVFISGVDTWAVTDGQLVTPNQVIGTWNPANRPTLHYMIFQNGVNIDPETTLR